MTNSKLTQKEIGLLKEYNHLVLTGARPCIYIDIKNSNIDTIADKIEELNPASKYTIIKIIKNLSSVYIYKYNCQSVIIHELNNSYMDDGVKLWLNAVLFGHSKLEIQESIFEEPYTETPKFSPPSKPMSFSYNIVKKPKPLPEDFFKDEEKYSALIREFHLMQESALVDNDVKWTYAFVLNNDEVEIFKNIDRIYYSNLHYYITNKRPDLHIVYLYKYPCVRPVLKYLTDLNNDTFKLKLIITLLLFSYGLNRIDSIVDQYYTSNNIDFTIYCILNH